MRKVGKGSKVSSNTLDLQYKRIWVTLFKTSVDKDKSPHNLSRNSLMFMTTAFDILNNFKLE